MDEVFLKDERETINFGKEFAKRLKGDEVICLLGDLGSGKTTFVKGLAEGLGIREGYQVRSPTFTIVNEYPTQKWKVNTHRPVQGGGL
jgi:tRNA threonylcarbamoyladenosine biosynthesis protein TsaE